jgi:hypothetical protein
VGVEHPVGETTKLYGAFTTDYSARPPSGTSPIPISNWDIYHVTVGSDFNVGQAGFTIGIGYAFGSNTFDSDIDLEDPVGASEPRVDKVTFRRVKLIIGFNFLL